MDEGSCVGVAGGAEAEGVGEAVGGEGGFVGEVGEAEEVGAEAALF